MQTLRILVPIDFSASSYAAAEYASALAMGSGGELVFTHVAVPTADFAASPDSPEGRPYSLASQVDPGAPVLDHITPSLPNVPYTHVLRHGDPAEQILDLARSERIDLIVIGTHGHTPLARILLGSVAESVVRNSPCPVLTLKLPTTDASP
jgi:nucleotide-binding universal stress UspA family protein